MSAETKYDNFDSLFKDNEEVTAEKIITFFFNPKDINMKTEIPDSALISLCALEAYCSTLERYKLKKSAKFIRDMIRLYKEFMVSRSRKGREEGTSMLGAIRNQIQHSASTLSRLLGVGDENKK